MTEHAAVVFVFFFLAEYGSIVLICILTTILFLGGYLFNFSLLLSLLQEIDYDGSIISQLEIFSSPLIEGLISGLTLGIKSCLMVFVFIWVRASFPRIRFDQLMSVCWTVLLPVIIAYIVLIPCIVYSLDMIPVNIALI